MKTQTLLKDPLLKRFIKKVTAKEYLFLQGQKANSMLLILEGRVSLIGEKDEEQHLVSFIEAGQFLGEKALLSEVPYQRSYTAQADTDTIYLEISSHDLEMLQRTSPEVMVELLKGILAGVAARFDRAAYLIRALRSSNNVERIVHCLVYFCRASGRKFPGGTEILASPDDLRFYVDMDEEDINAVLRELQDEKLIIPQDNKGHYLVPNERALIGYLPKLLTKKVA